MSFQDDLARGRSWEDELFEACSTRFPVTRASTAQQCEHGGDFSTPIEGTDLHLHIECKHDFAAKRTGNLYLELTVKYPDKPPIPGWTAKLPTYYVIVWKVQEGEYYLLNDAHFKEVLNQTHKVVTFNSKIPHSTGALLSTKKLTKITSLETIVEMIEDEIDAIIAVNQSLEI